jgi:O-antigen ligase/tetratricopeptide (TPR) repeat protein
MPDPLAAVTRATDRSPTWQIPVWQALSGLLVGVPIVVLPWKFGGVQASVYVWLIAGATASLLVSLWAMRRGPETFALPGIVLLLIAGLSLGLVQLVPWPVKVLNSLAPVNAKLWQRNVETTDISATTIEPAPQPRHPISLYPASTRCDLALLVGGVLVFIAGIQCFGGRETQLALFAVAALNGAAIAFWGLMVQLRPTAFGASDMALQVAGSHFSTFINRNHAAAFLNLSLGAALGLAIWSFARGTAPAVPHANSQRRLSSSLQQGWGTACDAVAHLTGWQLLSLAVMALIVAGVVCSMSRGGWVSATCAAVMTVAALGRINQRLGVWLTGILGAVAGIGLCLVLWLGQGQDVNTRLQSLRGLFSQPDGRLAHWQDGLATAADFWPLGSGLGTYRYAYLLHESTANNVWFYHAENHYLEALVEGGWLGLVLVLCLIALALLGCGRLLSESTSSWNFALGAGALFALVSQVVHGFFDFALYMPANLGLLALIVGCACGAAARLACRTVRPTSPYDSWEPWATRMRMALERWPVRLVGLPISHVSWAMLVSLLVAAGTLAARETRHVALADDAVKLAGRSLPPDHLPTGDQLAVNLQRLGHAAEARPDDALTHYNLALAHLLAGRTKLIAAWQSRVAPPSDPQQLWTQSAAQEMHGWAWSLEHAGRQAELTSLRQMEPILVDFRRANAHLNAARRACPLLAEVHLLLAQIAPLLGEDDAPHLERLRTLVTTDDRLLLASGLAEFQARRVSLGLADWQRVAARVPDRLPGMLDYALQLELPVEQVLQLMPDDPAQSIAVAANHLGGSQRAALREQVLARAREQLHAQAPSPERHYLAGLVLAQTDDDLSAAIRELSAAVEQRPDQAEWRYELAAVLQKSGQVEAAREQASLCYSQYPTNSRYERLLRELVRAQLLPPATSN